jgi:hypothetical protein
MVQRITRFTACLGLRVKQVILTAVMLLNHKVELTPTLGFSSITASFVFKTHSKLRVEG